MFVTLAQAEEAASAPGAESAGTEAGGGGGSFPPFEAASYPSQLLWLAIAFGLFYYLLKRSILPRIGAILEARSERIEGDLRRAALSREEADAAVAAYEQELAAARTSANGIAQQARDASKAQSDADRREIERGLEQRLSEAEARIATIKASAMGEVGAIAEETSAAIIERLTGAPADREALSAAIRAARG